MSTIFAFGPKIGIHWHTCSDQGDDLHKKIAGGHWSHLKGINRHDHDLKRVKSKMLLVHYTYELMNQSSNGTQPLEPDDEYVSGSARV